MNTPLRKNFHVGDGVTLRDGEAAALRARDEFPNGASTWPADLNRRDFLKLVSASLVMAGLGACNRPPTKEIVPYTAPPEAGLNREVLYYSTAFPWEGFARGVLVASNSGRPTKIEGNPDHPECRGTADTFTQASILELYDPDRSRTFLQKRTPTNLAAFRDVWLRRRAELDSKRGRGLALLTEPTTSPTLLRQIHALLDRFPEAKWHQHTPLARYDRDGRQLDFDFRKADIIFTIGADPFLFHPAALRYSRDFADRRRVRDGQSNPNRLYALEATLSITGSMADTRLPVAPHRWAGVLNAISATLTDSAPSGQLSAAEHRFAEAVANDLRAKAPNVFCAVGPECPEEFHRWAEQLNRQLGAYGATIRQLPAARSDGDTRSAGGLAPLAEAMDRGDVDTLVILDSNPVYTAPADLGFARRLARVPLAVHCGLHADETAALCEWHVPASHYLESWSDLRAFDGTASVVQPLIEPLYATLSAIEFVQLLADPTGRPGYDLVRETWRSRAENDDAFEGAWRRWLDTGIISGTTAEPIATLPNASPVATIPENAEPAEMTVLLRPDYSVLDGRWANNAWLQELPRPFTHLVWDNALLVSPGWARQRKLNNGDLVALTAESRSIEAPIWIVPGHADDCGTLHLGYGRNSGGGVAEQRGFNAYPLRVSRAPWTARITNVRKLGRQHPLVSTREHYSMEGRDLARTIPAAGLAEFEPEHDHFDSLYPEVNYTSYAWAMVVDLNTCIGCNACVVACQAENNIPVVGKEQCARGREMHWLRVDRYYEGEEANPRILHQPVPCMQCEKAPCELVCPVAATVHSAEGLNDMVYNRCVGTRYCSNNCPYKVRRFNFLDYRAPAESPVYLQANPNVTVRERGVMEKCTYCVQRINAVRAQAERENRRVRDGELMTACQQTCPVNAIVFGDGNDPKSAVAQLKREKTNYALLAELNTQPRTTYLMRVLNAAPDGKRKEPVA